MIELAPGRRLGEDYLGTVTEEWAPCWRLSTPVQSRAVASFVMARVSRDDGIRNGASLTSVETC